MPHDVEAALAAHHCALLAQQQQLTAELQGPLGVADQRQLTPRKPVQPREAAQSPVFALPGSPAADGGGGLMSELSSHFSDLDASVASVAMRAISQHGELPTAAEAEAELLHCRVDPHPHLLDTDLASVGPDEDWRDWLSADVPALGAAEAARPMLSRWPLRAFRVAFASRLLCTASRRRPRRLRPGLPPTHSVCRAAH